MQRDPMRYVDGMNLYEFLGTNPLYRKDPSGRGIVSKIYHCCVCLSKLHKAVTEAQAICGAKHLHPGWNEPFSDNFDPEARNRYVRCCLDYIKRAIPSCAKCAWALPKPGRL